jgi:hypothetical protein
MSQRGLKIVGTKDKFFAVNVTGPDIFRHLTSSLQPDKRNLVQPRGQDHFYFARGRCDKT